MVASVFAVIVLIAVFEQVPEEGTMSRDSCKSAESP